MNNNFRLYSNKELLKLITIANKYKPRFLVDTIINMIENKDDEKVIEIFGNRRTGKTIAMYHTIKRLLETENISKFIYIRCFNGGNVADICEILDSLEEVIEYIFIDEITYLDDIVCAINQITDGYPSKTIVLTGSSSLSFLFSEPVLFGRCKKVNTTFISYKEWEYLKDLQTFGLLEENFNLQKYLQDIDERILEDIVRIHLMLHFNSDDNNSIVIKSFRLGNLKEIDVVVDDIESSSSYLIEVKRNSKYHKNYGVWLVDDEIATIYKNTKDRILLYNGYTDTIKQNNRIIKCINIEEFLLNIDKFISFEENINGFKKLEI